MRGRAGRGLRDDAAGRELARRPSRPRSRNRRRRRSAEGRRAREGAPRRSPASACSRAAATRSRCALQMADSAQRTLDVQYFVLKHDDSGQLLMSAMLRAADRGVRVRAARSTIARRAARTIDPAARRASEHRDPPLQSVLLPRHDHVAARRRVRPARRAGSITGCTTSSSSSTTRSRSSAGRNVGDEYFETSNELAVRRLRRVRDGPDRARRCRRASTSTGTARWRCRCEPLFGKPCRRPMLDADRGATLATHRAKMRDSDDVRAAAQRRPARRACSRRHAASSGPRRRSSTTVPTRRDVEAATRRAPHVRTRLIEAARRRPTDLIIVSPYFVPGAPA